MARPKNRFGLSPSDLERRLQVAKKRPVSHAPDAATFAYVLNVRKPYAYEVRPSIHLAFWWVRILHEDGTGSAFPALVRDGDLVQLQMMWEIDDAYWAEVPAQTDQGFPEGWSIPRRFSVDGVSYYCWDYQKTAFGQCIRLRHSKFPHQARGSVPFGGLFGSELRDWVPSLAEMKPLPNLDEWTKPSMATESAGIPAKHQPLFQASANFFRRVVLENRWVPHAKELGIPDINAEIPIVERPPA